MAEAAEKKAARDPGGEVTGMARSIFEKVRQIKRDHPEVSRNIDRLEAEIRDKIIQIKDLLDQLEAKDRELVTVLVINGIHRITDEVLID